MKDELGREITEPRGLRTVTSCASCQHCYKITDRVRQCELCGWQVSDTEICDDYEPSGRTMTQALTTNRNTIRIPAPYSLFADPDFLGFCEVLADICQSIAASTPQIAPSHSATSASPSCEMTPNTAA